VAPPSLVRTRFSPRDRAQLGCNSRMAPPTGRATSEDAAATRLSPGATTLAAHAQRAAPSTPPQQPHPKDASIALFTLRCRKSTPLPSPSTSLMLVQPSRLPARPTTCCCAIDACHHGAASRATGLVAATPPRRCARGGATPHDTALPSWGGIVGRPHSSLPFARVAPDLARRKRRCPNRRPHPPPQTLTPSRRSAACCRPGSGPDCRR
jgi:hypothetical protein